MSDQSTRLECLKLAAERLGPQASHEALFKEARTLRLWIEGFDMPATINGKEYVGRAM